jgi:hypothetical protein
LLGEPKTEVLGKMAAKKALEKEFTEECCIEAAQAKKYTDLLVGMTKTDDKCASRLTELSPAAWIRVGLVGIDMAKKNDSSSALASKLLAERFFANNGALKGLKPEGKKDSVSSIVNQHACFWAEEADDFLIVQAHTCWLSWKHHQLPTTLEE